MWDQIEYQANYTGSFDFSNRLIFNNDPDFPHSFNMMHHFISFHTLTKRPFEMLLNSFDKKIINTIELFFESRRSLVLTWILFYTLQGHCPARMFVCLSLNVPVYRRALL